MTGSRAPNIATCPHTRSMLCKREIQVPAWSCGCWCCRWSLVVGCWSAVVGRWLLVVGCWLLVVGRWLLVVGCLLLVTDRPATIAIIGELP